MPGERVDFGSGYAPMIDHLYGQKYRGLRRSGIGAFRAQAYYQGTWRTIYFYCYSKRERHFTMFESLPDGSRKHLGRVYGLRRAMATAKRHLEDAGAWAEHLRLRVTFC